MADPQGKRRCDRCDFFEPETKAKRGQEVTYGFCHKYAPRPSEKQGHAYWPVVPHDSWCGEYFLRR
ncbi:MAG: hypothetical protein ACYTBJ_16535 [Planctomycetota bacterium]